MPAVITRSLIAATLGLAGTASAMQAMQPQMPNPVVTQADLDAQRQPPQVQGFLARFSVNALSADVKASIARAALAPVSFKHIVVHARDAVTMHGDANAPKPSTYDSTVVFEDAGSGLLRRTESVDEQGEHRFSRYELSYRGYAPFFSQVVPAGGQPLPPMLETRKLLRFDTQTQGHFNFTYFYGAQGKPTNADPGQVVCDSANAYPAAQIFPAIQGQALELHCQAIDSDGAVTDKLTYAYLQQYGLALLLHTSNPGQSMDSTITAFTAD